MNGQEGSNFTICTDTSDCIEFSFTSGLYLKPVTKLSITVTIPHLKAGQVISNNEIIEKLKIAIRPEKFAAIKATKSNLEFIRFDAELDNKKKLEFVVSKIDLKGIKLTGFADILKIRATEGKIPFPSRHDWDSYFKEAKHMNEKKPGERPDTVHIKDIPCEWFIHNDDPTGTCPSEYVVSKVFSSFGEIRAIDIPYLDPYRKQMSPDISGIDKFSPLEGTLFDLYVQYKEYIGFAKCMHTLQAKKLVIQRDETVYMAIIKVGFDKTKHLSDASMKRRAVEREKIMAKSIHLQEKSRMKKEISAMKRDAEIQEKYNVEEKERKRSEEKEERKKAKEEKRKQKEIRKRLKKLISKHKDLADVEDMEGKLTKKVVSEERKLAATKRGVEAIRLYEKIFDRIKTYHQKEVAIKTTMHARGIQNEPVLFGLWFNQSCQTLMQKKQLLRIKFEGVKSNENWLHYKKCSHKLKKASHDQKLKFIGSCLKNAKVANNKVLDEQKRRELVSCKKMIKLTKARQLDLMQGQEKRVEKVMKGKIHVIFLPCDDENKVALSPASSGNTSSSSATSLSDDSDSDKEKKMFSGKMRADQVEMQQNYGNPGVVDQFQGGQFFHGNYRPRGAYNMGQGHQFPYDNRGRGFRFFRPYYNNRGFRGGPHQGFDNRGRGFYHFRGRFPYDKNRGRGGYFENKKLNEHPIQLGAEKWFKRGNEQEPEEQSYYKQNYANKYEKSDYRSPSWSDSGSRKNSRSWSRSRSRSYSRSRSRSERRHSRDRSTKPSKKERREKRSSSRSSSNSRSGSRGRKGNNKKKSREDNSDERRASRRSSSSDSRSRSRDRNRRSVHSVPSSSDGRVKRKTKDRSRSRSSGSSRRSMSRHRNRSFEERHRNSRSRSRYSDRSHSRSPSQGRYRKHRKRGRTHSHSYDEFSRELYSDEYSEDDDQYGHYQGHSYNGNFANRRFNNDFRGRGRGPRQFYNYRGNPRQRRPRGTWRGRGKPYFNYNHAEQDEDYNVQYMNLYKKYFNRITEKDSFKRDASSEDEYKERKRVEGDSDYEYSRRNRLSGKVERRRASTNDSSPSPSRALIPLRKRLRHYGSSDSDDKVVGSKSKKNKKAHSRGESTGADGGKKTIKSAIAKKPNESSDSEQEKQLINANNQQREKDLRERLSRKLETKKLQAKETSVADEADKRVGKKSKDKHSGANKDRQKEQLDDTNECYRQEEERSRVDKLSQQDKLSVKGRQKRNIRERLDDSDEAIESKKHHRRSYSTSDEESLYGPLPPKHIQSRSRRS